MSEFFLKLKIVRALMGIVLKKGNADNRALYEPMHFFEKKLAKHAGVRRAFAVASGTDALILSLRTLGIGPGDEVVVPAVSFFSTASAVMWVGAKPVFVDVELDTFNIDVSKIESVITLRTKAIIPVHLNGRMADMDVILSMAKKHSLAVIVDAAHAVGSRYMGNPVGVYGDLVCLSFNFTKLFGGYGNGGAVLTDDLKLKKILASFRDWGRDCWCDPGQSNTCGKRFAWQLGDLPYGYDHKYIYSHIGYNLKATDMQAAVGVSQLKKLDRFTVLRKNNFQRLYQHLKPYENYFLLPQWDKDSDPNWFGFPLLVKETAPFGRDEIVQYLEERKIATRMLFGGNLLKQPAYKNRPHRVASALKNTETVMQDLFWIGVYPGLTEEHLDYVCRTFKEFLKNGKFEKRVHEDDIRHIRST